MLSTKVAQMDNGLQLVPVKLNMLRRQKLSTQIVINLASEFKQSLDINSTEK